MTRYDLASLEPERVPPGSDAAPRRAPRSRTAAEFLALPREPIEPYVSTADGRSVLLAPGTTLLIAGPSGVGKSLVAYDGAGRLAGAPATWLGLRVVGGLRVLLVPFEGEGSDEDVRDRIDALVPTDARARLHVWDRWRMGPAPRADDLGVRALADEIARLRLDVAMLDTGSAFFGGGFDVSKGVPEEANRALERTRELAGRPRRLRGRRPHAQA